MPETETLHAEGRATPGAPIFANILCAISGNEGGFAAVEHAAALAGPQGHLTFLMVTSFRSGGAHRGAAIGPARGAEILQRAEGIAREAGVPFTSEVDPGTPPARVILDWSAGYDLLAIGAPASSWPAKLLSVGVGTKRSEDTAPPCSSAGRWRASVALETASSSRATVWKPRTGSSIWLPGSPAPRAPA